MERDYGNEGILKKSATWYGKHLPFSANNGDESFRRGCRSLPPPASCPFLRPSLPPFFPRASSSPSSSSSSPDKSCSMPTFDKPLEIWLLPRAPDVNHGAPCADGSDCFHAGRNVSGSCPIPDHSDFQVQVQRTTCAPRSFLPGRGRPCATRVNIIFRRCGARAWLLYSRPSAQSCFLRTSP